MNRTTFTFHRIVQEAGDYVHLNNSVDNTINENHTSSYREVKIGKTLYCVTSIYMGEKELGPTLEKLAVRHVLNEMDSKAKQWLRT